MQQLSVETIKDDDSDVVILSPTGSGKTLAYLLPLTELINKEDNGIQAVVVVPGRELAIQSYNVLKSMSCGVRGMALYGGYPAMDEHRAMKKNFPQIIFSTPGRLNDHIDKQNIDTSSIRYLIIDEFDKCLALGFSDEMKAIISKLATVSRHILLSATEEETIPQYVGIDNVKIINFNDTSENVSDRVRLYKVTSPDKDKLETLQHLLCTFGDQSSIVFLNYRESVERVSNYLSSLGFSLSAYHGGMDQKMREESIYKFANGSTNVLVCTDLASRGIDIPNVENIIHYHLPENEEAFIHRTGRTARWNNSGLTFFILSPEEQIPSYIRIKTNEYLIQDKTLKPAEPRMITIYIGKGKKDKVSKGDIVGFLCIKGGLTGQDIGKIDIYDRYAYVAITRKKINSLMHNVIGEKIKGIKTTVEKAF